MIKSEEFANLLLKKNLDFFTGVPDSLLKNLCAYITDTLPKNKHIIAANEGNALTIAAGYYLGTGHIPVVYMQNSGLGNVVNPLTSLASAEVYRLPILLIIGWRGEPGVHDEPQHKQMGRIQNDLLDALEVPYSIIDENTDCQVSIATALDHFKSNSSPYALVIKKGTFEDYTLKQASKPQYSMTREEVLQTLVPLINQEDIIVSTTGKASRELFELREVTHQTHSHDFLCVGNMGHTSSLALGLALSQPTKRVWCIDGDGSMIMHMGATSVIGKQKPSNLVHIVLNNFAHDSVGGQPTSADTTNLVGVAQACGYSEAHSISSKSEIVQAIARIDKLAGPIFFEIKCSIGSRKDLGRPTQTPLQNKVGFMKNLSK